MSWLLGAIVLVALSATGPRVEIQRPVPDRVGTENPLEFSVVLSHEGAETAPLVLWIGSDTAPTDKLRGADGVSMEVAVDGGPWQPLPLISAYGWTGRIDLGRLPPVIDRTYRVRVRSTIETGRIPVQVRLLNGPEIVAEDHFRVEIVPGSVPPGPEFSGRRFGLGAAIGVAVVAAAVLLVRLVRRRWG